MSDTSDELFIMAGETPIAVDSDADLQDSDEEGVMKHKGGSLVSDDSEDDDPYAVCDALEEGYIDLDRGTLHRTLPPNMWQRHEERSQVRTYRPSRKISRYGPSLKHLIPLRTNGPKEAMPLDRAGLFSTLLFTWLNDFMMNAYKNGLKPEDVPLCSTTDGCEQTVQRLEHLWKDMVARRGPDHASLQTVAWQFVRTRVAFQMVVYVLALTFGLVSPMLFMRWLIQFCQDEEAPWWHGVLYATGLFSCDAMRSLLLALNWGMAYRTGVRLRSAFVALIYKKILRLSSPGDKSIGELINLVSNDGQRVFDVCQMGPMIVGAPFVAVVSTVYMIWLIGPSALVGIFVFGLFYPFMYAISTLNARLRRKTLTATDERVRLVSELVSCVKLVKMYAWEKPFSQTIMNLRRREHQLLAKVGMLTSLSLSITPAMPVVAVIATFLTHIASGNELTAAEAFSIAAVYAVLRLSISNLTWIFDSLMQCSVALTRIKSLLLMDEIKSHPMKPLDRNIAMAFNGATLAWSQPLPKKQKKKSSLKKMLTKDKIQVVEEAPRNWNAQPPSLNDINVLVPKGRLVAVCGSVGAGKSSLLSAVLGRMALKAGSISVDGSFAYVSQQAWIMNSSFQDNILFGEVFDAKRYYSAIWACSLNEDLLLWPAGDQTEMGERGINLSGGQRQRIAMARALYSNKDIYLLDDPLSAVDAHVSQHMFDHCIRSALSQKTVLFVTHQLQYLSQCDEVIYMADGRVLDQGPHLELMERNTGYMSLMNSLLERDQPSGATDADRNVDERDRLASSSPAPATVGDVESVQGGRMIKAEKVEVGSVPFSTYLMYLRCAGGYAVSALVLLVFAVSVVSSSFSSWWLAHWLDAGSANVTREVNDVNVTYRSVNAHPDLFFYELVYGLMIAVMIGVNLLRGFCFVRATLRASSILHDRLFAQVLRSPMKFFDTTPVGRILNLFSHDLYEIDSSLPLTLQSFLQGVLQVGTSIFFVALVFPWFLVGLPVLLLAFYFVNKVYRCTMRDLKRLENVSRSPVYSHVVTTVNGLDTIHAFNKEREFISKFMILFDENTSNLFLFKCCVRWLAVRLDLITVLSSTLTAALAVVMRGYVPASFAGLALALTGQLGGTLQFMVRLATETEAHFTSVQRMHTSYQTLEVEAAAVVEDRRPPPNWPRRGALRFANVKMRYRTDLPLVLKGISFDIEPSEKIGIVGRTGSGKSSLGVALFRLVELSSGHIKIDGLNVAEMGLEDLRSRLSVIPQEPLLFIGTVRSNLDPFQQHSDATLWSALERAHMKERVRQLPGQLDSVVAENGENLSVGERQLLCLARTLLRNNKILLLDEATAAIDAQTDGLVQATLRQTFHDCTVLTIAHRLDTVLQCDRIMVLQDGKLVEFDTPATLLSNPKSTFAAMMAAGDSTSPFST